MKSESKTRAMNIANKLGLYVKQASWGEGFTRYSVYHSKLVERNGGDALWTAYGPKELETFLVGFSRGRWSTRT